MIDLSTPLGQRAEEHLRSDSVVWLTTIGPDGTPEPSPVWFLWDAGSLLIYSRPTAKRFENMKRSPKVSLHFASDPEALEVNILAGDFSLDPSAPPSDQIDRYVEKYRKGIAALGWTPASLAADFSVAFRITPTRLWGFLE